MGPSQQDWGPYEEKITGVIPKDLKENNNSTGFYVGENIELTESENTEKAKNRNIPDVSFDDIGGLDDIIQVIREAIELPIKNPNIFEYLKIIPHKGILLYGPPGCGKTMIAKAIANEISAHFISIKGPELLSKWHGESENNLRKIFIEARELQPSIIFFDEIDSIAQARSSEEELRLDSRFVNQLLTLLDGIEEYGNIRILASTNRIELLDPALLRPGRFDYHIEIKTPTKDGCYSIFTRASDGMPIDDSFDKKIFAAQLFGLTGADIAFIVREAAYNCLRRCIDLKKAIKEGLQVDNKRLVIREEDFLLALKKLKK